MFISDRRLHVSQIMRLLHRVACCVAPRPFGRILKRAVLHTIPHEVGSADHCARALAAIRILLLDVLPLEELL